MRRRSAAIALCLLVLLAGCSALSGSGSSAGDAPGVEDGELADSDALLSAHEETLTESGYSHEVSVNMSQATDGETVEVRRRQRTNVAAGASEYEFQLVNNGRVSSRFRVWGNETVEYQSVEAGGNQQFQKSEPTDSSALTGRNILEPHLSAPYEVVETEEREELTLVTLESTGTPSDESAFPQGAQNIEGYESRLVIDTEGRIHRFSVSTSYDLDGNTTSYELEYELTSLEDPGVQRPAFVDEIEG